MPVSSGNMPALARAWLRVPKQCEMILMKFNGASWQLFGDIIAGEVGRQDWPVLAVIDWRLFACVDGLSGNFRFDQRC